MRTHVDWRSSSKSNYIKFCKKYPSLKLSSDKWKDILYSFNDAFRSYILETGKKARLPAGFGEFSINKKIRAKVKGKNGEFINLPVDWKKTKEKGKIIYNFNYHTEGYFFGWVWFKKSIRLKNGHLWWFKPARTTSRLIRHYLKTDEKYQHIYNSWKF